jgi:hypothetical protein
MAGTVGLDQFLNVELHHRKTFEGSSLLMYQCLTKKMRSSTEKGIFSKSTQGFNLDIKAIPLMSPSISESLNHLANLVRALFESKHA